MNEITKDQVCERAGDLVGFLYGELSDWEARKFERHMQDCAACKTDYAAFGQLRQSIVAWRDEALGLGGERLPASTVPMQQRRPSALGALREFFNLSPLWMKGMAVCASVLFCVFATLAVAHLIEKKESASVRAPADKIYTQQELDARVEKLVGERTSVIGAKQNNQTPSTNPDGPAPQKIVRRYVTAATTEVAKDSQRLRRPLSRQERQELAADLRLLASRDENDLDPGSDINNQSPPW